MSQKMKKMFDNVKSTLSNRNGQGLVEYALILVLIALVVIVAVKKVGTTTNTTFETVNNAVKTP